ncbi:helix-turn-helix domain-containing protein [Streptomyces sp. TLI_171]|uniref:helix-turn-helix domain-containing protein n=1 Tax=Streptomyces sp. TLI_171 TaxID=1938859 RepID=UPI000C649E5E|nr:XRE family transcriptional regulator [Streptomyces sp. TLI_171]RKE23706.1 XRE family transcriptional regulator [Streptomyces sp. TLI_171]
MGPGRYAADDGTGVADPREDGAAARLGERLHAARARLQLTLDGVAQRSGLSRSFLSRLEAGDANPTLRTLERIAEAVQTPLSVLLGGGPAAARPPGPPFPSSAVVHRPRREPREWSPGEGRTFPLTPVGARRFEAVLAEGTPAHHAFTTSHPGQELCVVLAGRIAAEVGGERFELEAGEALHYDAGVAHRLTALDPKGRYLLVVAGPGTAAAADPRRR